MAHQFVRLVPFAWLAVRNQLAPQERPCRSCRFVFFKSLEPKWSARWWIIKVTKQLNKPKLYGKTKKYMGKQSKLLQDWEEIEVKLQNWVFDAPFSFQKQSHSIGFFRELLPSPMSNISLLSGQQPPVEYPDACQQEFSKSMQHMVISSKFLPKFIYICGNKEGGCHGMRTTFGTLPTGVFPPGRKCHWRRLAGCPSKLPAAWRPDCHKRPGHRYPGFLPSIYSVFLSKTSQHSLSHNNKCRCHFAVVASSIDINATGTPETRKTAIMIAQLNE